MDDCYFELILALNIDIYIYMYMYINVSTNCITIVKVLDISYPQELRIQLFNTSLW